MDGRARDGPGALIRSKNYLDLANESHDDQRQRILLDDNQTQSSQGHQSEAAHLLTANDIQTGNRSTDPPPDSYESFYQPSGGSQDEPSFEMDQNPDENSAQQVTTDAQKLEILRKLFVLERQSNERRRQNTLVMQRYLKKLQADFLRQQQELAVALELSQKIKSQKDAQIEVIGATIGEKDRLIEHLRSQIEAFDEVKLRSEFQELLMKHKELADLERQQLKEKLTVLEQKLAREQVASSQTLQQLQERIHDQTEAHEKETLRWKGRIRDLEVELDCIMNEPHNLLVKALKEEANKKTNQIDELTVMLDESKSKREVLKKKLDSLVEENEKIERANQTEINQLHETSTSQRQLAIKLQADLEDNKEMVQILQFDLQRSERRSKTLLTSLKSKEEAYNKIISQLRVKHEEQVEMLKTELRSAESSLSERSSELDAKQNELVRLQMEHENQLESLRNDRDQRLSKSSQEKQRVEKESQHTKLRLAQETEQIALKDKLIGQLRGEVEHFKQKVEHLSTELRQTGAKLFDKQHELEIALESRADTGETNQQEATLELDQAQRRSRHLEATIEELRKDNAKLSMKLRVSELNLVKLNTSVNREQAKLYRDYEAKLEQIRAEQCNYDKSKLRYRKYGQKLKKYCSHLQQVHEHLCNPSSCGYAIFGSSSKVQYMLKNSKPTCSPLLSSPNPLGQDSIRSKSPDKSSLQASGLEYRSEDYEGLFVLHSTPAGHSERDHSKFAIKRTSLTLEDLNISGRTPSCQSVSQRSIPK